MKNVGSAVNGEETLNGRKDGNNSGRSSSRKERFPNLQRTWNITSSVLQMARIDLNMISLREIINTNLHNR